MVREIILVVMSLQLFFVLLHDVEIFSVVVSLGYFCSILPRCNGHSAGVRCHR
jgi:hypothetical protein